MAIGAGPTSSTRPPAEPPAPPGSPCRSPAAIDVALPSHWPRPISFRPRTFRPGLRELALLGSLLAHGVLLAASASIAPAPAAVSPAPHPRPRFPSGAFFVQAESHPHMCTFPPSEALAACFDRAALDARYLFTSPAEAYGYDAASQVTWRWVRYPFMNVRDAPDMAGSLLYEGLRECAETAKQAGWSGKGRVFVRVAYQPAGGVLAHVLPLDSEADHPGLLCCLRQSQVPLASAMRPGTTVRYTFTDSPERVTLTPPPL